MDRQNLRARARLVDHTRIPVSESRIEEIPATNIIMETARPEHAWVAEATAKIGDWRAIVRSVYLRWAITINACVLAEQRYEAMPPDKGLQTSSLRFHGDRYEQTVIAVWPSPEAAAQYAKTTPLLASHGIAELYGALEDIIFDFYEIVLRHNPLPILPGKEFKAVRRWWQARSQSDSAQAAWSAAWSKRFEQWRRKRLYDGLDAVFIALFRNAGLRRPSCYTLTDENDWARNIRMIAELRHHIVHGAAVVSDRLGQLSSGVFNSFAAGEPLEVHLYHLQSVECFCDQLLTALNISLVETMMPLPAAASRNDAAPLDMAE